LRINIFCIQNVFCILFTYFIFTMKGEFLFSDQGYFSGGAKKMFFPKLLKPSLSLSLSHTHTHTHTHTNTQTHTFSLFLSFTLSRFLFLADFIPSYSLSFSFPSLTLFFSHYSAFSSISLSLSLAFGPYYCPLFSVLFHQLCEKEIVG